MLSAPTVGVPRHPVVSNPGYVPRSFARDPKLFGKVPGIEWRPISKSNPAPALAARIQHEQCLAIRDAITRRHHTVANLIRDSNGQITEHFRRALNGEAVLQPRDLAFLVHHFGHDLNLPDPGAVLRR